MRSVNIDADGDEVMSGDGGDELASGEDAGLILSEESLKQIELRKGESYTPSILEAFALTVHFSVCVVRNPPKDSVRESRRRGGSPPHQFPYRPDKVFSRHGNGRRRVFLSQPKT